MKVLSALLLLFLFFPLTSLAQPPAEKVQEVFKLINEARSNPKAFLKRHQAQIKKYQPKLVTILQDATPIEAIIWDAELAKNCKELTQGNLKPSYKGDNTMCGKSTSQGSGYSSRIALYFICNAYTHIMNPQYAYFGFYMDDLNYALMWGRSCNNKKYSFEFNGIIDDFAVDFEKLNTAKTTNYLSAMDKEMIQEINFVRQYPNIYADIISQHLADVSKSRLGLTKDKLDAGKELIAELKTMQPAQLLYPKKCVYLAAQKHGDDCKKRGFIAHTGSDGSSPFSRISKFCPNLTGNENLVGGRKNVRSLVITLLIDAGISSRGHRYNMLNSKWEYVACYGYQGKNMYNYVQKFAKD